jgi:hypothetical protein
MSDSFPSNVPSGDRPTCAHCGRIVRAKPMMILGKRVHRGCEVAYTNSALRAAR